MPSLPRGVPQFLFDDTWVAESRRLQRQWFPATLHPRPVLQADRPWEPRMIAFFGTVLPHAADGFRLYYQTFARPSAHPDQVLLATSQDGFRWEKPALALHPAADQALTNIVHRPRHPMDSPSLIHEPGAADPWKLLTYQQPAGVGRWSPGWGLYAATSDDGLRWRENPTPVLAAGDRTNLMATRPGGHYRAYTRHRDMWRTLGSRAIYLTESSDFHQWSDPELVLRPDLADPPDVEFYGMAVFERHGWQMGLLEYWYSASDRIEIHLVLSRDGRHWMRPCRTPFIANTHDWNRAWLSPASNGPVQIGDQLVFYINGRLTSHSYDSAQQDSSIGLASLGVDRFCAFVGTTGGDWLSRPLVWPGGDLQVNADTRQSFVSHPTMVNGQLGVEVLAADGTPLCDWSGERQARFHGNTVARTQLDPGVVKWPGNRSLGDLAGQEIRLRWHLQHARLYTFGASV